MKSTQKTNNIFLVTIQRKRYTARSQNLVLNVVKYLFENELRSAPPVV